MKTLFCLITALLFNTFLFAQEKKTLYQIQASALLKPEESIFNSGFGVAAGAYYPISPSFNMGPALSADFIGLRNTSSSYNPVSIRFTTLWFPEKLMNSILPAPIWSAIYFKGGIGHSFNYGNIADKLLLNSVNIESGVMLPVKKRRINIHVGVNAFILKRYIGGSQPNSAFTTIGIGYNWFKYKNK